MSTSISVPNVTPLSLCYIVGLCNVHHVMVQWIGIISLIKEVSIQRYKKQHKLLPVLGGGGYNGR